MAGSGITPTRPLTWLSASSLNRSQAKPQLIANTTWPALNSLTVSGVLTSAMFFFITPASTMLSHWFMPLTAAALSSVILPLASLKSLPWPQ